MVLKHRRKQLESEKNETETVIWRSIPKNLQYYSYEKKKYFKKIIRHSHQVRGLPILFEFFVESATTFFSSHVRVSEDDRCKKLRTRIGSFVKSPWLWQVSLKFTITSCTASTNFVRTSELITRSGSNVKRKLAFSWRSKQDSLENISNMYLKRCTELSTLILKQFPK